jgi:hypothetical protein
MPVGRKGRVLRVIAEGLLLALCGVVFVLWFFQEALIYPARPYSAAELQQLPTGLRALHDPATGASASDLRLGSQEMSTAVPASSQP